MDIAINPRIRPEIAIAVLSTAVLYFQIYQASSHTVSALILITLWSSAIIAFIIYRNRKATTEDADKSAALISGTGSNKDTRRKGSSGSESYYVKQFPKLGLQNIVKNHILSDIGADLAFTAIFDKARYQETLLLMDKFQKVYMYILGGRYNCTSYIPTMVDISDLILENLYSFYIVVPSQTKHIYGLYPHDILKKNITLFTSLRRSMLNVVNTFSNKVVADYVNPVGDYPRASDAPFADENSRRLGK